MGRICCQFLCLSHLRAGKCLEEQINSSLPLNVFFHNSIGIQTIPESKLLSPVGAAIITGVPVVVILSCVKIL